MMHALFDLGGIQNTLNFSGATEYWRFVRRSKGAEFIEELFRVSAEPESIAIGLPDVLRLMPPEQVSRFANSPRVAGLLRGIQVRQPALDQLAELLLAETRSTWHDQDGRTTWNVLGLDNKRPIRFRDNEISCDYNAPWKMPTMDRGESELSFLSPAQIECVIEKLTLAFEAVDSVSSEISEFVSAYVNVIVIRAELSCSDVFSSSSFLPLPGLCLLCNAHLDTVTIPRLQEALVHEAIHCFLFLIEELQNPILRDPCWHDEMVSSPWTGTKIGLHSFVHASAVWYGMHRFWSHGIQDGMPRDLRFHSYYMRRVAMAENGFKSSRFSETLGRVAAMLSDDALALVGSLQRAI
jgi:hypothetical protein